ncbi:MAG TPA: response regulator, partial [Gammaproteobacteria bacterium]|nr:response regulator [Gammaproteobacteria bacterium]
MSEESKHAASRFVYTLTAMLGIAFAVVLFIISWNNVVEQRKRESVYELNSLSQKIAHNVLVSNNVMHDVSSFIYSDPQMSLQKFNRYTHNLLERYSFIDAVVYYPADMQSGTFDENTRLIAGPSSFRADGIIPPNHDLQADEHFRPVIKNLLVSGSSPVISSVYRNGSDLYYVILGLVSGQSSNGESSVDNSLGIISVFNNPEKYFGNISLPDDVSLTLYSEYASVGRQLLFSRQAELPASSSRVISTIVDTNQIQLPSSTIKLDITKHIYWQDIDKGLLYISLLIGLGVTLLLVALIRTRDLQARELRERNVVIEKKVEEQTRELALARDKALDASRMKSEFLASMSHEIRTPLNAIIGMSELLSETQLSDEQKKYSSVFKRAGDTLLSLVNDILDLSKIEARQLEIESIPFGIVEVVEETVEIYALKAAEKTIELIADVDPGMECTRLGDPARIRQILLNLISNALKFTDHGEIVVRVRPDTSDGTERVLFSVQDTGIGIAEDKLQAIFESFTQADSSTTRKYGGTGLGLSISKSLVELMHGQIWVESEQDRGSIFHVNIPLPLAQVSDRKTIQAYPAIRGRNILLVCPSQTSCRVITAILQHNDCTVDVLNDATEIFSRIPAVDYDLLLLDNSLVDNDAFHLVSELQSRNITIPVLLIISPLELNDLAGKIRQYGIASCLVKPIKKHELLEHVENCFRDGSQKHVVQPAEHVVMASLNHMKILLVDDNADNRLLLKAYLKNTSCQIDEAENGQEALDRFKQGEYDLVFMDVQMPIMDGHASTRAIRYWETENNRKRTPIIALTAHATREEIDKCLAAGCDSHVAKPVKKKILL